MGIKRFWQSLRQNDIATQNINIYIFNILYNVYNDKTLITLYSLHRDSFYTDLNIYILSLGRDEK